MVHCASSPVTSVSSVPNKKHLRRWESSDTEQVACSRRSVRGDAWNRLLNMSFIIKLVRPRQMFFFLFFSSPSCFLAILWSSAASINNWPSYLTSSQLDFTDFANKAKITHVGWSFYNTTLSLKLLSKLGYPLSYTPYFPNLFSLPIHCQ